MNTLCDVKEIVTNYKIVEILSFFIKVEEDAIDEYGNQLCFDTIFFDTIEEAYNEYVEYVEQIKYLETDGENKIVELWVCGEESHLSKFVIGENYLVKFTEEDYGKIRFEFTQETPGSFVEICNFEIIDESTVYSSSSPKRNGMKYKVYNNKEEVIDDIVSLPRNFNEDTIEELFNKLLPDYTEIKRSTSTPQNILTIPKIGQEYLIQQLNEDMPYLRFQEYYDTCVELLLGGVANRIYNINFFKTWLRLKMIMDLLNIVIESDATESNIGRIIWITEINNIEYNRIITINNIINS